MGLESMDRTSPLEKETKHLEEKQESKNSLNNKEKNEYGFVNVIANVKRGHFSSVASEIKSFIKINFPKFNRKLDFNASSKDIKNEFSNKVMNYLTELGNDYPEKTEIIEDYKREINAAVNDLFIALDEATAEGIILDIINIFEDEYDNYRTFLPIR